MPGCNCGRGRMSSGVVTQRSGTTSKNFARKSIYNFIKNPTPKIMKMNIGGKSNKNHIVNKLFNRSVVQPAILPHDANNN